MKEPTDEELEKDIIKALGYDETAYDFGDVCVVDVYRLAESRFAAERDELNAEVEQLTRACAKALDENDELRKRVTELQGQLSRCMAPEELSEDESVKLHNENDELRKRVEEQ